MEHRRILMMQWDGLGEDDNEFFESRDRISTVTTLNIASSGSDYDDNENYDDTRVSFTSALSTPPDEFRSIAAVAMAASNSMPEDYNIWMAEPGSIKERRKRLLQGMGLFNDKELLRRASMEFKRAASRKGGSCPLPTFVVLSTSAHTDKLKQDPSRPSTIVRSKSQGSVATSLQDDKHRREQFISVASRNHLTRSSSSPSSMGDQSSRLHTNSIKPFMTENEIGSTDVVNSPMLLSSSMNGGGGAFFLIKNLDTGKEFIVNEFNEDGMWNRLKDLQTGKQLTMEEFEKCVGYSPIVKELMHRENVAEVPDESMIGNDRKSISNAPFSKSFRSSKRRGVGWLKNIKGVKNSINGFIGDKERDHPSLMEGKSRKNSSSGWTKVRQHGTSCKELTGLYMCQEIQAHQGSIWTIKFSLDARYLASAGEDRIIHVWEVVNCGVLSSRALDDLNSTPLRPMASNCHDRPPLSEAQSLPSERKRRGLKVSSSFRKGSSISDYVIMPETIFSLSEKPVCSFQGHLDDVLDLSWSKSQKLLSSSMDKTVRLWDMESKSCLKLFAHNDYVTCIQFNPVDDRYFISGSLDAKVRIWSIPNRQVVDWTDLHEMVTAVCYTPDGKGALIGSHKGGCRLYNTSDFKLHQKGRIDVQNKKKSHAKKITGFQFAPGNPSEVLITSADSRIRIFDGSDVIHKFRGFRNTSSQISASFTADGKYVVCASEDSQVYVWKRDEIRNVGEGKSKGLITTRSHERFQCRDVSVAIPWPGSIKYEPPLLFIRSKRHSKRRNPLPPPSPKILTFEEILMSDSSIRNSPHHPKNTSFSAELANTWHLDSGIGGSNSFASASTSCKYGDSPYISASGNSISSSLRWFDGSNSSRNQSIHATAWGMVIVTAGLGGEIRTYQNFGLPLRLSRQTNLFRDHT